MKSGASNEENERALLVFSVNVIPVYLICVDISPISFLN